MTAAQLRALQRVTSRVSQRFERLTYPSTYKSLRDPPASPPPLVFRRTPYASNQNILLTAILATSPIHRVWSAPSRTVFRCCITPTGQMHIPATFAVTNLFRI